MSIIVDSSPSLTLAGVGPGDPSLVTLAAVRAIQNATVIAYPVSRQGEESVAAKIVGSWISAEKLQLPLLFPMVTEVEPRKRAWRNAGDQLAEAVANGERVVFLCQGDVSLFSSSSYVLLEIKANHPECPVKLIPGVNAVSAAAAAGCWPLCLQRDQLLILPTPDEPSSLEALLHEAACSKRVLALLKLGNRWIWVRPILSKMGLLSSSLFAQRVGFSDQKIMKASEVKATSRPYFSLLLVRQTWPEVLP